MSSTDAPRIIESKKLRTLVYPSGLVDQLRFADNAHTLVKNRTVTDSSNGYVRSEQFEPAIHVGDLRPAPRYLIKRRVRDKLADD